MAGNYRIEHDTMGQVQVPVERYWGAQTQRSLENFKIGGERMPREIIHQFAILKKAAALVNEELGVLDNRRAKAIEAVCEEILTGIHEDEFPLVVWQTGSGTQTNMNVNEVIANRANEILLEKAVHPNDHVNCSQSSNDTFPTAMHMAAVCAITESLLPSLRRLEETFEMLSKRYMHIVKTGRTHLQDATPITLGQEISAWAQMLKTCGFMIENTQDGLRELALGGTAVGTGLNAHRDFAVSVAGKIAALTGKPFRTAGNKFHALTSRDALAYSHGALKTLACDLMKIANDIRWLASGPRCGIGEICIPENEPGSSIMPGKVNPTQCEALTMVCAQVMGNDVVIGIGASQGNFQLNVYMPVMIYNYLQSVKLLTDGMESFRIHCAWGIVPNMPRIEENLGKSLMMVTALSPHIGYEKAACVAKRAHDKGISLKEAAEGLGFLSGEEFEKIVVVKDMV